MQKWLITGSTGFLGSNAGRLLSKNHQVIGLSRQTEARFFDRQYSVDLTKPQEVEFVLREVKPDVVLHCAALASHEQCELDPHMARSINVESSVTLAGVSAELGSKFIQISTDAVFDGERGNYSEFDPVNPFSVYGETKAQAESGVASVNPEALIVRTNFFGWSPTGQSSVLEFFVNALTHAGDVTGYTDYTVTSIYVDHLIATLQIGMQHNWVGPIHVASSDARSKFDFGRLVAAALHLSTDRLIPGLRWNPRSVNLSMNTDLLLARTGSRPPTQQAGVTRAIADRSAVIL